MEHVYIVVQIENEHEIHKPDKTMVIDNTIVQQPQSAGTSTNSRIELLDYKTLRLNLKKSSNMKKGNKMYFDLVTLATEDCFSIEFQHLMDDFLLQRHNCCFIHFTTQRIWQLKLVYHRFIQEVNKRLERLSATVTTIRVDYEDIAKINTNAKQKRKNSRATQQFHVFKTTQELLAWLLNDQYVLWNNGKGHLFINFTFTIVIQQSKPLKLEFALFEIYVDMLDRLERLKWRSYVSQLGRCNNFRFLHSDFTHLLNNYLEGSNETRGRTLCLFNVPVKENAVSDTVDILNIADALFKRRNQANLNFKKFKSKANVFQRQTTEDEAHHSETFCLDTSISVQSPYMPTKSFEQFDISCLSAWYRGIDEKFTNLRIDMNTYLVQCHEDHVKKMCNDIKFISQDINMDHENNKSMKMITAQDNNKADESYRIYKNASEHLKELSEDIKHTQYSKFLEAYLKTKQFELEGYVRRNKIKQLMQLSDIISNELCKLNSSLPEKLPY
ncbi:uncharacterized protein LOC119684572 [Teleopsis dalmanni]|uniref:uncharacterized protein LOC119684572 n=1 Tax=Teleopsis dalmanni TaxID=139649 RepID=UPI0018CF88CA|nr:uncharacterized protein LOC119684572 [Teleopsis dalmanni]